MVKRNPEGSSVPPKNKQKKNTSSTRAGCQWTNDARVDEGETEKGYPIYKNARTWHQKAFLAGGPPIRRPIHRPGKAVKKKKKTAGEIVQKNAGP